MIFHTFHIVADRAKQIKTKATVNEDPTDKLIRELKEQNEKLKAQLSGGKIDMNEINKIADRENLTKEGEFCLHFKWPKMPVLFWGSALTFSDAQHFSVTLNNLMQSMIKIMIITRN